MRQDWTVSSPAIVVAVKPGSLAMSLGTRAVLAFDLEGRLYSAYLDGRTFRRGLGGRVLEKRRFPGPGRGHRWSHECEREERLALYATVRGLASEVLRAQRREEARVLGADGERATVLLSRVIAWSPDRLEAERERFRAIYRPVGILPPDQYLAVVLQATEGCAWNRCTFCGFYRGQRYRVKTTAEFLAHARAVRGFLGAGVRLRHSVFLGEASAIGAPLPRLVAFMDIVRREFPADWDVHAFMDVFTTPRTVDDVRPLADRGLRRVIVGMETGSAALLAFVRKPASPDGVLRSVAALKAAGVSVSVVVLVGLGGVRYFDEHVVETVETLAAMHLGEGDIVYFSPLADMPGAEYAEQAHAAGIGRLSADEVRMQERIMRDGLRRTGTRATLARYDVGEFLY